MRRRKPLSDQERQRRAAQRRQSLAALESEPLLLTRAQTARLLNCSIATLQRLEKQGALKGVKLNKGSPSAMTFYRRDQIVALAQGDDHAR